MRIDGRQNNQMRDIQFKRGVNAYAEGSCLVETGKTQVLCTVSVEEKVPLFLKDKGEGWLTSEYRMLPRSTQNRIMRERLSGRIYEIQRLIGRALRSIFDTGKVPGMTFMVDCDVLQADGGTRTAAINGSFIALVDACVKLQKNKKLPGFPIRDYLAAISVGIVRKDVLADLNYSEDSQADIDMNVVMTGSGRFVEVQGTGERSLFDRVQLDQMLSCAEGSIQGIIAIQKSFYKDVIYPVPC